MFPLHPHDPPAVGPYRLHARLGEDAYARVYLGSTHDSGPVAVKVVRPEYATEPGFRGSFSHQVEIVQGLASPHVCAIRDADTRGAVPWVAVTRPLGPSLADLIRRHGPLPVDALRPLALALAQGLADLHASNRAHGSLWPDGVLMSARSTILADPGLEWAVSDTDQRAPHPAFAAPEGGASSATDVFSWAATLCYAASGIEGPDGLDQVPMQLRGLVDTCLKHDPRLRPSSEDLVRMLGGPAEPSAWSPPVRAAIDAAAEQQRSMLAAAPPAAPGGPGGDAARPKRTGLLFALGGGAMALVVLAAAVFAYTRWDGEADTAGSGDGDRQPLISEAGCADGIEYPPPGEPVPADTQAGDMDFSPDGDLLAVASSEGLMIWDWQEGEEIARPTEATDSMVAPVFAPVGCAVAAAELVGYEDREYNVTIAHTYDLPSGTTTEHLGPQEGPDENDRWIATPQDAGAVDFSPNGGRLVLTLDQGVSRDSESTVVIDTATGESGVAVAEGLHYNTRFVDDDHFATNNHGEVDIWNADTGEAVYTVPGSTDSSLAAVPGETQVAYLEGDTVVVTDYTDGSEVASFTREEFETDDDPSLSQLLVDPDRSIVHAVWMVATEAGSWEYRQYAWDLESGEDLLADLSDPVSYRHLALHPEGEVVAATTAGDQTPVLLDPETFEQVGELY
ncbi:protein kinase domain-containing protein [Nocardiopsis nanhaiensis]